MNPAITEFPVARFALYGHKMGGVLNADETTKT
jgi:hypothetical protein